jgi:hypothetical protein
VATVQQRAVEAAWSLGHTWFGAEHVLLAVLSGTSASAEALQASGVTPAAFARDLDGLPDRYIGDRRVPGEPCPLTSRRSAQVVLARAEGLAAGFGSTTITDDHALVALLWERSPTVAEQLLGRHGVTRAHLLDELDRRGVRFPQVPPPARIAWAPWVPIPSAKALGMARALRRDGTVYRLARRGAESFLSTAKDDQSTDPRPRPRREL